MENQNPNSGRQTPISQRRPLQKICLNTAALDMLSPTKRRKQCHADEAAVAVDPVKPGKDEVPVRADCRENLLEVFSRLGKRDLIEQAAPVCKMWHEVAHSKELWAILRGHFRLFDQLLVSEKVVERRSKGKLLRCLRLGTKEAVLLRVVDLELTNAGRDDGVPTSFLREAALLSKLRHPNVIRHYGSEILGKRAVMCTEFVHESFTQWYKRLEEKVSSEKVVDIRVKFRQLLTGLSHVHHQGVMHRNLKPDNIFLDAQGTVKLGDFTTTRMLDIPLQAYTPEDPKERDRSGREMRRLWYRAPELILRDEIYGPKVDAWSVGCLLAEAATGKALFQSDSEIDHLFRVFRMLGTPTAATWPEVLTMKNFSPKFPVYPGFSLSQVIRAVCGGSTSDQDALLQRAQPDREDIVQNLMRAAAVLGEDGMRALDGLVCLQPSARADADAALQSPFFRGPLAPARTPGPVDADGDSILDAPTPRGLPTPSVAVQDAACPPMSLPSSLVPAQMAWDILQVMRRQERAADGRASPELPPGVDAGVRAQMIDFIIGLANTLSLTDYTLHLAAGVLDRYMAKMEEPPAHDRLQVIGATCLKVADVFTEQSKEYYKQENAVEYADATHGEVATEQILTCEKDVLRKLDFNLHLPTTHCFLQCYLAYGRFTASGSVAKTAFFIADLTLLDNDLLAYFPSLRAQCCLVLAVLLAQQAQAQAQARRAPQARSAEAAADGQASAAASAAAGPELAYLEHWNRRVRDRVCRGTSAVDAAMCMQEMVRALQVLRRQWKSDKLTAVETKHAAVARTLVYPERFPVSKLVRYIIPDSQQGLIAE